ASRRLPGARSAGRVDAGQSPGGHYLDEEWPVGQPMAAFLAASGARVYDLQGRELAFEQLATVRALRSGESVRQHQEVIRHTNGSALSVLVNAIALAPRRSRI